MKAAQPTDPASPRITLSSDGYIRLTFEQFLRLRLAHLCSGLDESEIRLTPGAEGACATTISGYTEWVSDDLPARPMVTIGWSWALVGRNGGVRCVPVDPPGHNLMFLDTQGRDVGLRATTALLYHWLERFDWQSEVLFAVNAQVPVNSCQH